MKQKKEVVTYYIPVTITLEPEYLSATGRNLDKVKRELLQNIAAITFAKYGTGYE